MNDARNKAIDIKKKEKYRKISDYTGKNILAKPAYKGLTPETRKPLIKSLVRHIYHERKKGNPRFQVEE